MNKPLVSVVMITYNHKKFIRKAIEGVLNQEGDFILELIIADDASVDKIEEIVYDIKNKHSRGDVIKYTRHKENKGMMLNFIWALSQCKGKYIALCEGDDYWTDDYKLKKQIEFLEINPDYALTYHDAKVIDGDNNLVSESKMISPNQRQDLNSESLMKIEAEILTLTMCFRNYFFTFPKEMELTQNGDAFLVSLLGNYGHGKFMDDVKPACFRLHSGGVFSGATIPLRLYNSRNTYRLLSQYYRKMKNNNMSEHFNLCKESLTEKYLYYSIESRDTKNFFRAILFSINDNKLHYKPLQLLNSLKTVVKYIAKT